jgi:glutamate synthase domain-containing protein 1
MALEAVARVAHRGAASTDNSGWRRPADPIPTRFHRDAYRLGLRLDVRRPFAVGVFFLPVDPDALAQAVALVERVLTQDDLPIIGWREVPVNPAALGASARQTLPVIRQLLVGRPDRITDDDAWERALYLARRGMEQEAESLGLPGFYVPSMSCRTILYKALLQGTQLPRPVRPGPSSSAVAVNHQRYPPTPCRAGRRRLRLLAHNGEINTLGKPERHGVGAMLKSPRSR